ncbi:MAG: nucleoid-associated protein [Bacteroidetes bacterium]|nr:MAG: nucleoid-associated protein [Bacteroidota bacterium]MBL1145441.1 nucleoid-associated protein [Bacteroidota bacterium]NOG58239.1 nucleoid-associated protein [Bacteroidota bacterium]
MIDSNYCELEALSAHHVGNKEDEELHLSKNTLAVDNTELSNVLIHYFLKPFDGEELYNFTFSNNEFKLNPLFNYSESVFKDAIPFHENSIKIAQYLFDVSNHPNIKPGDLFIARFTNIKLHGEPVECLGIFKSENRHPFLTVSNETGDLSIQHTKGINVDKLDKGCLIFNKKRKDGFQVAIIDKSNKSTEAQYWKDNFLNLKPCNDGFHNTKAFLNIAKTYVTKQMPDDFVLEKTDKIDLLNRSVEYFKTKESFNKEEFETQVFQDEQVIESFRAFDHNYRSEHEIQIQDDFDISTQAVKKQQRLFKSILKLDKNFHVYIHGDKSLIEKGVEADGRKFYKIYYEKED